MARLITISVALLIVAMSLDLASIKTESVYFNHEDIQSIHPFHLVMKNGVKVHGVDIKDLYFSRMEGSNCLRYNERTSLFGMQNINYFINKKND